MYQVYISFTQPNHILYTVFYSSVIYDKPFHHGSMGIRLDQAWGSVTKISTQISWHLEMKKIVICGTELQWNLLDQSAVKLQQGLMISLCFDNCKLAWLAKYSMVRNFMVYAVFGMRMADLETINPH